MYVREVHVLLPPSDSENPIRIHQPRGRARTVWGRRHKPHAINCDPVQGQAAVLKSRYCGRGGDASARHARWEPSTCVSEAGAEGDGMFWSKKQKLAVSGPCCV